MGADPIIDPVDPVDHPRQIIARIATATGVSEDTHLIIDWGAYDSAARLTQSTLARLIDD